MSGGEGGERTADGGKDADDARVAQPVQGQAVEAEDNEGAKRLPEDGGAVGGEEEMEGVGEEDEEGDTDGDELEGEEGRDEEAGPGTEGDKGDVRVGDEAGIGLNAAAEQLAGVGRDDGGQGKHGDADEPAAVVDGQGQAEEAGADDDVE